MALGTYGELKTSIASFLSRAELTSQIPDFVKLCHAQLMRDLRGHLRLQTRNTSFSITGEYVAAPSDFLELVSMRLNTTPPSPIQYMPEDLQSASSTGQPAYVSIVGATTAGTESFRFFPVPGGTYTATIEYYSRITFFANDAATNWILTDYPDLYLYGSLMQASAFLFDDPRAMGWQQAYNGSVAALMRAGKRARWGANGMTVRPG